jgi:hypothetical protein
MPGSIYTGVAGSLPFGVAYLLDGASHNTVNFDAGNFGQITTQAGTPRIFQFGIKYMF